MVITCKVSRRENAKKAFIAVFADGVGTLQYATFYRLKIIGVEIWIMEAKHSHWSYGLVASYDMTAQETGPDANSEKAVLR